ncbi:MAG: aminomethyl-transferring glycine dehydrogenase subunit GcvPA [Nitrospinae bacterium]|jgi:glycine dehydrogenase subunit 1|nr:aminomethyl-transferring glycine dehydrogenase subunit GcvPA [Nitrospinota bacterium]MDA1110302.1 aminomethyl-transferring glycine dehydrogenase subunit GcvPA [Nitrospinota bacterium]
MRYIPHTEKDIQEMLAKIGVKNIEEIFQSIPEELRLGDNLLNLPKSLSESELTSFLGNMQKCNANAEEVSLFMGAGAYRHFSPVLIDHLISRGEFATSYTPYQPEVSQGTLQAIFEFQTMIAMLTGMDIANASMYDGASALAEAVIMASRLNNKNEILISRAVHPEYRQVVTTYTQGNPIELVEIPFATSGKTDVDSIKNLLTDQTSAVVLQSPNFFGVIEEYASLKEQLAERGVLLIVVVAEALSLGILKPPGERGADIVVGEGQSFGLSLSFGGPYVGFFATQDKFLRQTPGRLVGETIDRDGRRSYVLTLSTREQHIRRERATSNICTNQGLCALAATIYLATMGKQGLREVALLNVRKADYLKNRLRKIKGFSIRFDADTFNEFVLECPKPAEEIRDNLMQEAHILAGVPLGTHYPELENCLLLCATELNTQEEMDRLAEKLEGM